MNKIKIEQIENIEQIESVNIKTSLGLGDNLYINFLDEKYDWVINNFIDQHLATKSIYINTTSKLYIDLIEYDIELYLFFINCVEDSVNIIFKYKNQQLFGNIFEWNFIISSDIMFNFPFTLEHIIYIPITYIKECFEKNDKINFTRTLIHEKIHIGQRTNIIQWDNFIKKQNNHWIKINRSDEIFELVENNIKTNSNILSDSNYKFITNPDSYYNDFKYIYLDNNEYYYGHYVYNQDTKKIKIKFFNIDINNKTLKQTNKVFDQEHPYETFAYKISDELI